MATFVLVPGGWHGSWSFEAVTPLLERAGHAVHALTLTGLRPDDDHVTIATANLDTHADDVVRLLDRAHITSATLVGHSYGGMVIAAAADRADGRISRLVHLDAYVPRDGESCWSSTSERYRRAFTAGCCDHRLRRPTAGRGRSPPPSPSPSLVPADDPTHRQARPGPPSGVRLLLGMGRPDAVRRPPHPTPSRSRVAGPRPPHRPRRHA